MSVTVKIRVLGMEKPDKWVIHAYPVRKKQGNFSKPYIITEAKEETDPDEVVIAEEIIVPISSAELKQVKSCNTAREVWDTLRSISDSKEHGSKTNLLKTLILSKMKPSGDIRKHLNQFMETADKLKNLGIEINNELLSVIMLYSIPDDYDFMRIGIEIEDTLPSPEELKTKLIQQTDAKIENPIPTNEQMFASCRICKQQLNIQKSRLYALCRNCLKKDTTTKEKPEKSSEYEIHYVAIVHHIQDMIKDEMNEWQLDSGCQFHMTYQKHLFTNITDASNTLGLASNDVISEVKGAGSVSLRTKIGKRTVTNVLDMLYVPSLSFNALSVSKMTSDGYTVTFFKNKATVCHPKLGVTMIGEKDRNGLFYVRPLNPNDDNNQANNETPGPENVTGTHLFQNVSLNRALDRVRKILAFKLKKK